MILISLLIGIVDSVLVQDDNLSSLQPNPESYVLVSSDIAEESKLELTKTNCVSLNGVDWIQLLDSNFAEGRRLAVASELVYRIRQAVFTKTGFRCSAGIGPNKVSCFCALPRLLWIVNNLKFIVFTELCFRTYLRVFVVRNNMMYVRIKSKQCSFNVTYCKLLYLLLPVIRLSVQTLLYLLCFRWCLHN